MANPTIGINTIATDDTITLGKAFDGIDVSGTTANVENGQIVTINIYRDSDSALEDTLTATVGGNSWDTALTQAQADALPDGEYTVTADVSDLHGDVAPEATHSVTVDLGRQNLLFTGFVSDDWTQNILNGPAYDSTNWTGGAEPTSQDDVEIGTGSPFPTVVIGASTYEHTSVPLVVNQLTLDASFELDENVGPLTINTALNNLGTVNINNDSTLIVAGEIANNDLINVVSSTLELSGVVQLVGTGDIDLIAGTITGFDPNLVATLQNYSTITGGGLIGDTELPSLQLENQLGGVIDDDSDVHALKLSTATPIDNAGTIEDTGAAGVNIINTSVTQSDDGVIGATGVGTDVVLNGTTVVGGTLETASGGAVIAFNNTILDGGTDGMTLTSGTVVSIADGQTLFLDNTIVNGGTIDVSTPGGGFLGISSGQSATLSGSGSIAMDGAIAGGGTLINVGNTISGTGPIDAITLYNSATIDANSAGQTITLQEGAGIHNSGMIEATLSGKLTFANLATPVDNVSGVIGAFGTSAVASLNAVTIDGGTLETASGGVVIASNNTILDGGADGMTLTSGTIVSIADGQNLFLDNTIVNGGTIDVSTPSGGFLGISSGQSATLSGSGSIAMDGAIAGGGTVINVGNTISGTGPIDAITLYNSATIDANSAGQTITLQEGAGIHNSGMIEATLSGKLTFANLATPVDNVSGVIGAFGTSAVASLNAVTIDGGTLETASGGVVIASNNTILDGGADGMTLTSGTIVSIADGQNLFLDNTIVNGGTIDVSTPSGGFLGISSGQSATLSGSGSIAMDGAIAGGGTVINVGNTISGTGPIDAITLYNSATIDANSAGQPITLQAGAGIHNSGMMEATLSGKLTFANLATPVDNVSGVIGAFGTNAVASLNAVTIDGGTLETASGGVVIAFNNTILDGGTDGMTLTSGTVVSIADGQNLFLDNTIVNGGTIDVSTPGGGFLGISSGQSAMLSGSGSIAMDGAIAGGGTLINAGNTISGTGTIEIALVNQPGGIIDATEDNGRLAIDTGITSASTFNTGLIEATGSAGLLIENTILNNSGGVIQANGGSHVDLQNSTIYGGTLRTSGTAVIDAADNSTTLDGVSDGAMTNSGTVLIDNHALAIGGTFHNSGTIELGGSGGAGTLYAGGTFDGQGRIALSDNGGNLISGGFENVDNTITGGGTISADITNDVNGVIAAVFADTALDLRPTLTISNNGTLEASGGTLYAANAVSGSGKAEIAGGGTAWFAGNFQEDTQFQCGDAGMLRVADAYSGTISGFTAGDTIDLTSVAFDSNGTATVSGSVLDVFESGQHHDLQFASALSGQFVLSSDGGTGTDITQSISEVFVASGETLMVSSGLTSANITVQSGGTLEVVSGGTALNTTVSSGGTLVVLSGGFADPTVISGGGRETINAGGTDTGAQIDSGGVQVVYGMASGSRVGSTAADYVEAGGTASGTIISSGGDEFVESGGVTTGTVADGGSQVVYGTASGTTLNSGSYLYLESGTAVSTTVTSGVEVIYGTAIGTTDSSGGYDYVFSGGAASGTIVDGGDEYVETAASASGTTLNGGEQVVYGTTISTMLDSGAYEYLEAGGTANGTMVNSGVLVVYGTASGTTDQATGADYVYAGGTASGTTVSGGDEFVETGGTAIGTMVDGGAQVIYGTASGTVLNDGAEEYLESGTASGTTINNGLELVYGLAIATTVNSAGGEYIEAGGTALGTTVSGGVAYVYAGALASGTVVDGGAQVLYSGGTAVGTTLNDGGYQYVYAGATASGTVVDSSGVLQVNNDGTALGTTVNGSGYDYINAGGMGSGAILHGGGNEVVEAGGTALGTTASGTAADEFVYGTASGAVLVSGGEQVVEAGGTANATTIGSGGYEYVASGGIVSGASISGGTLELTSGAVDGSAPIIFAGAGGLVLDAAELFSGTVAGFGSGSLADTIDLKDIAYNSATTTKSYSGNTSSGTLTVNNGSGTATANIALLGQYMAGNFTLASDGAGGTLVTDPPLTATTDPNPITLVNQHPA